MASGTESQCRATAADQESIKWGQLSYKTKNGTPIRIDKFSEGKVALFVNCQTTLVEQYKNMFSQSLNFSKNRAIVLEAKNPLPIEELKTCIELAMNYHLKK